MKYQTLSQLAMSRHSRFSAKRALRLLWIILYNYRKLEGFLVNGVELRHKEYVDFVVVNRNNS